MTVTKISNGVVVSVEVSYQPSQSYPVNQEFIFSYRITLTNHNTFPLQLLQRHWFIIDSNGEKREVEGEGVVGQQPVLHTDESFQYVSGCNLRSEVGKMFGYYTMINLDNKVKFNVTIPPFNMVASSKLN